MSRSLKLQNDNYLDISSIVYNQVPLINMLTFSTEEHIVGKWKDGKNLYEKTLNFKTPSFEGGWGLCISFPAEISLKKIDGMLENTFPVPFYISSNEYLNLKRYDDGTYHGIQVNTKGYTNKNIEVTILYTKTTD